MFYFIILESDIKGLFFFWIRDIESILQKPKKILNLLVGDKKSPMLFEEDYMVMYNNLGLSYNYHENNI